MDPQVDHFVLTMKIDADEFRIAPFERVKLHKRPTLIRPLYKSNEHYQELLGRHAEDLRSLQNVLYASNRCALLVIFQRSEEHTSELQSRPHLVCRLLLEKKTNYTTQSE